MKHITSIIILAVLIFASAAIPQSNTWVKVTGRQVGSWGYPALTYVRNTHEFVLAMGAQSVSSPSVYSVQVFSHALGKWINALPNDTLYGSADSLSSRDSANGKWADSTGLAYGYGLNKGIAAMGWRFSFMTIKGYLRPNTCPDGKMTRAYSQFCYNSDNGKIYFFLSNLTFTYDPALRKWDTLQLSAHPNGTTPMETGDGTNYFLKWGSLCYDAYNHEVVLFGGGGLDKPQGSPGGTWTFSPATRTWTQLNLATQPGPRANSPMAYDAVNHCIVLFGGDHLDCLLNDTWVYDCVSRTWSKKNPAIRPKPRGGHALLYMPKSGKVVMMGGYRYEANQATEFEMWTYDVSANTWSLNKHFGASDLFPALAYLCPAFSGLAAADNGDTVVALGDSAASIYGFAPQTLRMACDPSITDASGTTTYGLTSDTPAYRTGAYDPAWYVNGVAAPDTGSTEATLRGLTAGVWTKITPPKTPAGDRTWGTAVLDPDRDLFMRWAGGHAAYCGNDVPQYTMGTNRWTLGYPAEFPLEYDGNNECNPGVVTFSNRPFLSGHTRKCYAYDPNLHRMIHVQNWHTFLYNPDSMDWDKAVHIHNAQNYSADRNGGLCITPHGAYGFFAASYLFSADSLRWRRLPQTGTLPGFSIDACGLVYDSMRDRILYANQSYGNTTTPAHLYEYNFATGQATQLFPGDSALATGSTAYRESAYLPKLDIVLFQFFKGNSMLAYDCANNRWITIPVGGVVTGISSAVGAGMMYDAKRDRVWLTDNASNIYALRLDSASARTELNGTMKAAKSLTLSPNPFNPLATIRLPSWETMDKQTVSLRVFAVDGRCVADLSKAAHAGDKVLWQAKTLPAGVYVVKYEVDKKVWHLKAALVR